MITVEEFVKWVDCIEDVRQQSKIWYTVQEVILIVFSATLSGIYEWKVMEIWARHNIAMLKDYLDYPNGIPSHDTLQRVIGMISTDHLQKAYKQFFGTGIIETVIGLRMEMAKSLLKDTNKSVTEIAALCGYSTYVYFTKQFSRSCGMTPTAYRNAHSK